MKLISFLFFALQILAVYIFIKGFFVSREKVSNPSENNPLDDSEVWFDKKTKVIFYVIDGLRFDYLYYNESLVGHEQYSFQNKFVKLQNRIRANPENNILFKIYAEPPTITVPKLKAMITGNLPPLAEITENLLSSYVRRSLIVKIICNLF